jgi:transcription elongation factor Elf1
MSCAFCGERDKWIKTCRTADGSRIRVCDPCYEVLGSWLMIVPGDEVVTAHCDGCGAYFNPREMAKISPGGRYNAYAGTCSACSKVPAGQRREKVL